MMSVYVTFDCGILIVWIGRRSSSHASFPCQKKPRRISGAFPFIMKEFAEKFYSSNEWKACRASYKKSVGGLCERCLKKGLIVPGEIVHHKTYIDPDNITDPEILMSFDNLELLCRTCHGQEHMARKRRYKLDELGRVLIT